MMCIHTLLVIRRLPRIQQPVPPNIQHCQPADGCKQLLLYSGSLRSDFMLKAAVTHPTDDGLHDEVVCVASLFLH